MLDENSNRPANKIARLIDQYDLDIVGEELESRWTAEGNKRMSLRELADYFNKRLLEKILSDEGMSTVESDVEQIYRRLTDDDVSTGIRTETQNELKRNGINVEKLERDFVSYQAIRSYLKDWRNATYESPSDDEKIESDLESIQRLIARTESVTKDRIENLRETGRIEIDDFEILLNMQIFCQQCGNQYDITSFLQNKGCKCIRDENN